MDGDRLLCDGMPLPIVEAKVVFSRAKKPQQGVLIESLAELGQEMLLITAVDYWPGPIDVNLQPGLPIFRSQGLDPSEEIHVARYVFSRYWLLCIGCRPLRIRRLFSAFSASRLFLEGFTRHPCQLSPSRP